MLWLIFAIAVRNRHLVLFLMLHVIFIYPREREIKETTETAASSSYLDCYRYIDN